MAATLLVAGAIRPAHAQKSARKATRVDSLRAVRDGLLNSKLPVYYPAIFTFTNGRQVQGYVDDYRSFLNLFDRMHCYEVPPDHLPLPPLKTISIKRLKSVRVDGHLLESLVVRGKSLNMLAENLTTGGQLRVYGYTTEKDKKSLPRTAADNSRLRPTGTVTEDFWFVRPAGSKVQEVPRGDNAFAKLMAVAFADYPALAARVQQQAPDAGYSNMPQLVQEYNAHFVIGK